MLNPFSFAGASVDPDERTLRHRNKVAHLTPHEVDLIELLLHSEGGVLTYDTLYSDILDRRFRGDTSNMRVLLGKLMASARTVGLPLRNWVQVVPKLWAIATGNPHRVHGTKLARRRSLGWK